MDCWRGNAMSACRLPAAAARAQGSPAGRPTSSRMFVVLLLVDGAHHAAGGEDADQLHQRHADRHAAQDERVAAVEALQRLVAALQPKLYL